MYIRGVSSSKTTLFFEKGSHAGPKLPVSVRLAGQEATGLDLPTSAGITGACHHNWLLHGPGDLNSAFP